MQLSDIRPVHDDILIAKMRPGQVNVTYSLAYRLSLTVIPVARSVALATLAQDCERK